MKQGRTQGGCCRAAASPNQNKKTRFVDTMELDILHDLHLSRNQPLKLTDDQYINILKNKIK
jgi:hypothetical protein